MKLIEVVLDTENMETIHIPGDFVKTISISGVTEEWCKLWDGPFRSYRHCEQLVLCLDAKGNTKWTPYAAYSGETSWLFDRLKCGDLTDIMVRIDTEGGGVVEQSAILPRDGVTTFVNELITTDVDEDGNFWLVCSRELTAEDILNEKEW